MNWIKKLLTKKIVKNIIKKFPYYEQKEVKKSLKLMILHTTYKGIIMTLKGSF